MDKSLIEQYIQKEGEFIAVPVGTSMWPLLRNRRDTVHLVKYSGNLKKYDLPIYKRSTGEQVMHRCIGINEDGYIMCGDNQSQKEFGIKDSQIIAVAKGIYRDEKYVPVTNIFYRLWVRIWCINLRVRGKVLRVLRHTNSWKKINEQVLIEKKSER